MGHRYIRRIYVILAMCVLCCVVCIPWCNFEETFTLCAITKHRHTNFYYCEYKPFIDDHSLSFSNSVIDTAVNCHAWWSYFVALSDWTRWTIVVTVTHQDGNCWISSLGLCPFFHVVGVFGWRWIVLCFSRQETKYHQWISHGKPRLESAPGFHFSTRFIPLRHLATWISGRGLQ